MKKFLAAILTLIMVFTIVACGSNKPETYLAAIKLAVEGGAKIIITPGFLFEVPVYEAQELYKDVNFVLIDGNPNNGDYSTADGPIYHTSESTVGISFAEEESGYYLHVVVKSVTL